MNKSKLLKSQPIQWLILDRLKEVLPDNMIKVELSYSERISWDIIIYPRENPNGNEGKDVFYQLCDSAALCLRINVYGGGGEDPINIPLVEYLRENSSGYKFEDWLQIMLFLSKEELDVDNFAEKVKEMVDYFDDLISRFNAETDWHKVTKDAQSVVYTNDGTTLVRCNDPDIEEYQVKQGTKVIWADAFKGKEKLRKVIIPEGVTHIYTCAFEGCKALEFAILPSTLQFVGYRAFGNTRIRKRELSRVARCDNEATGKHKSRTIKLNPMR